MNRSEINTSDSADFRIDAGWILSVDDDNRVLENHSLVVGGGKIIDCVPGDTAEELYSDLSVVDRRHHILMPGLVNTHMHMPMNLLRGLGSDQPLMSWLRDYIWPAEAAHMSAEFCRDGTELALAESLLGGVTTVNDMYFFADDIARVCQRVGVRATIGMTILGFPTPWAGSTEEYFDKGLMIHDMLRDDPLLQTTLAPHAPYTVDIEALEKIKALSGELNVPVHMHIHETAVEVHDYVKAHGVRPIAMLEKIGLLGPSLLAVHLTQMQDSEIASFADKGVHVLHCPESNLKLASGFCPISKLVAKGANVAMGTDGAASNNDLDLLGETQTAALLAKAVSEDAASIPAVQALRMATINGAKALGIDQVSGSLEIGKSADIACIQPDLSMLPIHDVIAQVIYATTRDRVSDVWVAGKQLVKDRQLTTIDSERLSRVAIDWGKKIRPV